jgi:uncharacterized protein with NAD-binding domain and iron-sulfur cluster
MIFQVPGADAGLLPPGTLRDVAFHGYVLRARRGHLRRLLQRTFLEPTDGALRVEPMGDRVVLLYTHIGRLTSGQPGRGWLTYSDVALWVPARLDGRPVFFPAYIFVDHPHTMVTGRETYGLPKEMGWFHMPHQGPGPLTCEVWGTDAPGGQICRRLLWSVQRPAQPPRDLPLRAAIEPARWIPSEVIGLQQLRDPRRPARALHQAVVTAPIRLTTVHQTALYPGEHALELSALSSHPVARDTGLVVGTQPIEAAFVVRADVQMDEGQVRWQAPARPAPGAAPVGEAPRKVAVLGGGIAALTAALELTEPGENNEVTVYTRGWRLGGKGASGRNADAAQRIEEHGLHVWYGFYENAFRLMRRVFGELERPGEHPLSSFERAFRPQRSVTLCEQRGEAWKRWRVEFPDTPHQPGVGEIAGPWGLKLLHDWLRELLEMAIADGLLDGAVRPRAGRARRRTLAALPAALSLEALRRLALRAPTGGDPRAHLRRTLGVLRRFRDALWPRVEGRLHVDALRRLFAVSDMTTTILRGLLDDDLLTAGLDSVNHEDLRDWMRRHGAREVTVDAPIVRFIYNAGFSFAGGDPARPAFAAGAALRGVIRLMLTYKGAILYKMNGGMGDVIFAPLYELLRRRGVTFRFFHSVEELELEGDRIAGVRLLRQCDAPGYQPLVEVDGVECWPSAPLWSQIEGGDALRGALAAVDADLEEVAVPPGWDGAPLRLREGRDFDDVVLAIPTGAQRRVCRQLMAADARWAAMVTGTPTVATQSYQLWLETDLQGLGWDTPEPILGTFLDPVDTWSDMSYLLPLEHHPASVQHLAYFCGVIEDRPGESRPEARARVERFAADYAREALPALWPGWRRDGAVRWDLLHDPAQHSGAQRLEAQVVRINFEGAARYTQSLPGTMHLRMTAHGAGVDNLFLAGDWTDNGFNCGCIEATVMSGMQAARAVSGRDIRVLAETDEWLCDVLGVPWTGANRYLPPRRVAPARRDVSAV